MISETSTTDLEVYRVREGGSAAASRPPKLFEEWTSAKSYSLSLRLLHWGCP
jgi:hypothetical protein